MNPADTPLSTEKAQDVRAVSKVLLGKNEDDSLGDSTSESSEELPQRGRAGVSIYTILVKWEIHTVKHIVFFRRLLLVTGSRHHRAGV